MRVLRDHPGGVAYHVHFPVYSTLIVPEVALTAAPEAAGGDAHAHSGSALSE